MFGRRYFGARFFGPRYWGDGGATPPPTPTVTVDGSGIRFVRRREQRPEEVAREQRMVAEYLASLDAQKKAALRVAELPARQRKKAEAKAQAQAVASPILTEAMARAASDLQLQTILEAAAAREEDRRQARAEFERRYWTAFLALAMNE